MISAASTIGRIDVVLAEVLAGSEKGVHRALAVGRHENEAARGRRAFGRGRREEVDAGGADILREEAAEGVGLHLADKGAGAAKRGHADERVGRRSAGDRRGLAHRAGEGFRRPFLRQGHRTLGQAMGGDERVGRLGDDVDDGIAQAENVVAALGHRTLSVKLEPGALLQVQG